MDASTAHAVLLNLLEAARSVAKHEVQSGGGGMWQRQNLSLMVRRMRLLLPVLEELRDNSRAVLLLPSAVAAIQQLHSTVLKAAELVERVRSASQLWLLAQLHAVCDDFNDTARSIALSLGLLPLDLLEELPLELKEQIELLRQQAERSNRSDVEAAAVDLQQELLGLLTEFENKKSPNSDRIDQLFKTLGLDSATERQTELEQLQRLSQQPQAASLTNFLCYSSCVLYGTVAEDREMAGGGGDEQQKQQEEEKSKRYSVPDEFKCPISLELMREPVIISSGQTYERSSIQRWLDAGNMTCPKSGQKLVHTMLIPNFALRSLIAQWCERNQVELPQQQHNGISSTSSSSDERRGRRRGDHMTTLKAAKMTASFLVGKLATGCPEIQRQAAYELRLLAKTGMDNRRCIADAGAIPLLVPLLQSEDPRTQEIAITALLNLSILDSNKPLIMSAGALDPIVDVVLCNGHTREARENAAATVFSLSTLDENKAAIGSKEATIPQLLELLRSSSADAVSALFNLSLLDANRKKVVQAGAVELLVDILERQLQETDMVENMLALLGLLASSEDGASCMLARASAIPTLVRVLESGAEREKENAAAVLLALCKGGDQNAMCRLMDVPGCISALHNLLANGSSRGKRKATSIMRALEKWNP